MSDYRPIEDYTFGKQTPSHPERWLEPHRRPLAVHRVMELTGVKPKDYSNFPDWVREKKSWWSLHRPDTLPPTPTWKFGLPIPGSWLVQDYHDAAGPRPFDFRLWQTDEDGSRLDLPKKKPVLDPETRRILCGSCQTWTPVLNCKACVELNMIGGLELCPNLHQELSDEGLDLAVNLQQRKSRRPDGTQFYNFEDEPLYKNRYNKAACSDCKQAFTTYTHYSKCLLKTQDSLSITGVEKRDVIDERILAGFVCERHERRGCFDCVYQSKTGIQTVMRKRRQQVRTFHSSLLCRPSRTCRTRAPLKPCAYNSWWVICSC